MNLSFLEEEIARWKVSDVRRLQITGERYYRGDHDILRRKRTVIGEGGALREVQNLPNHRIVNNQYARMADQKVNYLLAKPVTFEAEDEAYGEAVRRVFDREFLHTLKCVGLDAINCALGWLHPYYDEQGEFCIKRFPAYEILPFWADRAHKRLDAAVRLYEVERYEGRRRVTDEWVELYRPGGVSVFRLEGGRLKLERECCHILCPAMNWARVPLVPFRYNDREIPLITRIKSLQDSLNLMLSDFQNNMQEDARNTILVLKNYDGTDLGEFRRNLAEFGAVKVRTVDGAAGGIETLNVEVNAANFESILALLARAIVENAMGFDTRDVRVSAYTNRMSLQSMYADIDLDANAMECEFTSALMELLAFVDAHLGRSGEIRMTFNRDMMMNEAEIMATLHDAGLKLSNETLIGQVPFVHDVGVELRRLQKEETHGRNDTEQ